LHVIEGNNSIAPNISLITLNARHGVIYDKRTLEIYNDNVAKLRKLLKGVVVNGETISENEIGYNAKTIAFINSR
jgi:hypothetical protein